MEKPQIVTMRVRFDQFFPPEHPHTPWLYRLAVLRDDLNYELENMTLKPDAPPLEVWRCVYVLRGLVVTIHELKNIFANEVRLYMESLAGKIPRETTEWFEETRRVAEEANQAVLPIRDKLGGHVRPSNTSKGYPATGDPTPQVITSHGETEFVTRQS